jgi:hypothetical protein
MFYDGHAVALDRQSHPHSATRSHTLLSCCRSIGLHVALDLEGEHLELVQINFHTPSDFIVEGMQVLLNNVVSVRSHLSGNNSLLRRSTPPRRISFTCHPTTAASSSSSLFLTSAAIRPQVRTNQTESVSQTQTESVSPPGADPR